MIRVSQKGVTYTHCDMCKKLLFQEYRGKITLHSDAAEIRDGIYCIKCYEKMKNKKRR